MTKEELCQEFKNKIATNSVLKLTHKSMKTVEFYAMGYEESTYHKINGYWVMLQTGGPIIQETIKIKKEDLQNWSVVKE